MKKFIISTMLLLMVSITASADSQVLPMEVHTRNNSNKSTTVDRAPRRIPIEVRYDSKMRTIEIVGNDAVEAEVYLYTSTGDEVDYSASVNTVFYVPTSGIYVVLIQGDNWYAEGEVEM